MVGVQLCSCFSAQAEEPETNSRGSKEHPDARHQSSKRSWPTMHVHTMVGKFSFGTYVMYLNFRALGPPPALRRPRTVDRGLAPELGPRTAAWLIMLDRGPRPGPSCQTADQGLARYARPASPVGGPGPGQLPQTADRGLASFCRPRTAACAGPRGPRPAARLAWPRSGTAVALGYVFIVAQ